MNNKLLPEFDFTPPRGYLWLIERDLVSFEPFGRLLPWYYLDRKGVFLVNQEWPLGPSKAKLVAFARRQDNDDIACFELGDMGVHSIVVINGWTSDGYEILVTYQSFWEWLKSVVDDIAEVSQMEK